MSGRRKYRCILADPPWRFRDQGWRISPDKSGHYKTMSLCAIIGLGDRVVFWSARNAHLWLCAPNALIIDGTATLVARMWGFRPVQQATWVKNRIGVGHWMRNRTEQVLLCIRGRLGPLSRSEPTDIYGAVAEHSKKPDELYDRIESVSPGPRLEMFARRARRGWYVWGDQAPDERRID